MEGQFFLVFSCSLYLSCGGNKRCTRHSQTLVYSNLSLTLVHNSYGVLGIYWEGIWFDMYCAVLNASPHKYGGRVAWVFIDLTIFNKLWFLILATSFCFGIYKIEYLCMIPSRHVHNILWIIEKYIHPHLIILS